MLDIHVTLLHQSCATDRVMPELPEVKIFARQCRRLKYSWLKAGGRDGANHESLALFSEPQKLQSVHSHGRHVFLCFKDKAKKKKTLYQYEYTNTIQVPYEYRYEVKMNIILKYFLIDIL